MASDIVVRCLAMRLQGTRDVTPQDLHDAVHEAHELLLRRQRESPPLAHMHATVVALWIDRVRGHALWSHVGDSRLHVFRGARLEHVTRDDSVVQQLLDAGFISPDAASLHPLKHHLACAMGMAADFAAHTLQRPFVLQAGDALLLCSDGWWDGLDTADMLRLRTAAADPQAWLHAMARQIEAARRPHQDNYSAIALWVASG